MKIGHFFKKSAIFSKNRPIFLKIPVMCINQFQNRVKIGPFFDKIGHFFKKSADFHDFSENSIKSRKSVKIVKNRPSPGTAPGGRKSAPGGGADSRPAPGARAGRAGGARGGSGPGRDQGWDRVENRPSREERKSGLPDGRLTSVSRPTLRSLSRLP